MKEISVRVHSEVPADLYARAAKDAAGSKTGRCRLVVIVPAYNEEEIIADSIVGLRQTLDALPQIEGHICVIDDGSDDRTSVLAREAGADRVIVHKRNRGLGAAVRSGLTTALEMG